VVVEVFTIAPDSIEQGIAKAVLWTIFR